MNEPNEGSSIKTVLLWVSLAFACVVGVELAYCHVVDPQLYETIVTPVRILYHDTRSQVKGYAESFDRWEAEQVKTRAVMAVVPTYTTMAVMNTWNS